MKHKRRGTTDLFVETQLGIVTRTGHWFHTTTEQIKEYAPGLLEKYSLDRLIEDAHAWVRSADNLALTLLFILLFTVNPILAGLITITFHWLWYNFKSSFVNKYLGKVFSYMNTDAYLLIVSMIALSFLGIQGQYLALGIGLIFFFLLKLGLLNWLWNRLTSTGSDKLTLNDRILKMIIVKYAMHEDLAPAAVQQMEDKLRQMAFNRKKGKEE